MALSVTARRLNENTTATYQATLISDSSDTDTTVAASTLTAATLTYYDQHTGTVIRDDQDVLNDNNVTISEAGLLTWSMQTTDTEITTEGVAGSVEPKIALWTFTTASITATYETQFDIQRMEQI